MDRRRMSRWATGLVCAAALGVLLAGLHRAAATGDVRGRVSRALWNRMLPSEPASAYIRHKPGTRQRELVGVLIATSGCVGTRNPDFVPAVQAVKAELARRAAAEGKTLRLVGVALDDRMSDGLALLARVGPFHEISVGGNWLNSNAVAYVWRGTGHLATVPQWVILERDVAADTRAIVVAPDQVVATVVGADRMRAWVAASRARAVSPAPGGRAPTRS